MIHKGELLANAIKLNGIPITIVAKRLGKSRRHIYNLFDDPDVSIDTLLKIGKIINYDFSLDIKEILKIPVEYKIDIVSEPIVNFEDAHYWKSKYFELLDKHRLLLDNKLKEYFENDIAR